MTNASMTFGQPRRLVIPRGSAWAAAAMALLIDGLRRLDRWQLSLNRDEPRSVEDSRGQPASNRANPASQPICARPRCAPTSKPRRPHVPEPVVGRTPRDVPGEADEPSAARWCQTGAAAHAFGPLGRGSGRHRLTASPGAASRSSSRPPCELATSRHRYSPSPTPPAERERAASGR
jgi:hypothetical protein